MSQPTQPKKPSSGGGSGARAASAAAQTAANKLSQSAYSAAESTRQSAQNVVNISSKAMRDMLANGTDEVQKVRDKAYEISQESVENFARSADMATKLMVEMIGICRDNIDAYIECCNATANICKDMSSEVVDTYNRSFSDTIDISKEAFSCRTVNDVVDLQNKAFRQIIDAGFSQANKLSNMAFQCCTEALEPINERVAEASEKISKALAA